MNQAPPTPADPGNLSRDEMMSALFANLVVQQTNLAQVFLGKMPHPEIEESRQQFTKKY